MTSRRRVSGWSPYLLAAILGTGGTAHFVAPAAYDAIIPAFLPAPRVWTYASGVAEIACAALLMPARTRRLAGWATAVLLVAVFPANVVMAVEAGAPLGSGSARSLVTWLRLPLQVPLVAWAISIARGAGTADEADRAVV